MYRQRARGRQVFRLLYEPEPARRSVALAALVVVLALVLLAWQQAAATRSSFYRVTCERSVEVTCETEQGLSSTPQRFENIIGLDYPHDVRPVDKGLALAVIVASEGARETRLLPVPDEGVAYRLTTFLRSDEPAFSFTDADWFVSLLVCLAAALATGALMRWWPRSARVEVDAEKGSVRWRRRWSSPFVTTLTELSKFDVETREPERYRVVAVLSQGDTIPLTPVATEGQHHFRFAERANEALEQARDSC